ncbi:MAG TPA: tetratricopeptide repeat protein, partial [Nitrospira sp.]
RSVEELEKALKIAPGNSLTKLYLAESYLDNGRKDDAKAQLNEILTMQPDPRWDVEHKENIQEAKKLLEKYFKK